MQAPPIGKPSQHSLRDQQLQPFAYLSWNCAAPPPVRRFAPAVAAPHRAEPTRNLANGVARGAMATGARDPRSFFEIRSLADWACPGVFLAPTESVIFLSSPRHTGTLGPRCGGRRDGMAPSPGCFLERSTDGAAAVLACFLGLVERPQQTPSPTRSGTLNSTPAERNILV